MFLNASTAATAGKCTSMSSTLGAQDITSVTVGSGLVLKSDGRHHHASSTHATICSLTYASAVRTRLTCCTHAIVWKPQRLRMVQTAAAGCCHVEIGQPAELSGPSPHPTLSGVQAPCRSPSRMPAAPRGQAYPKHEVTISAARRGWWDVSARAAPGEAHEASGCLGGCSPVYVRLRLPLLM